MLQTCLLLLQSCLYLYLSGIQSYHASDKIVGILLDRSRSYDAVKMTVFCA